MNEMITGAEGYLRAVKNHEAARKHCRRFLAFAEEIVRRYPDRVEPYRLLAEAHLQDAKNATRAGDRASVGRSLRQSLEAALKAEAADPDSAEVHRFVFDRRQRLARYESGEDQLFSPLTSRWPRPAFELQAFTRNTQSAKLRPALLPIAPTNSTNSASPSMSV